MWVHGAYPVPNVCLVVSAMIDGASSQHASIPTSTAVVRVVLIVESIVTYHDHYYHKQHVTKRDIASYVPGRYYEYTAVRVGRGSQATKQRKGMQF